MTAEVSKGRWRDRLWCLAPAGCALLAFMWPLYYVRRTPGCDWAYFDSLALVVRSNVRSYGRFPLHDPWVMGGLDLLANPQTRVFSPLGLFDLVLRPHVANVLSLVVLAAIGAWGMARVLAHLGNERVLAHLGALMWIGGSWFMLHFNEGHIPYGAIQLLPWSALWLMHLDQHAAQVKLAALLAFFLLDGGIYAFIFSIYGAIALAALGLLPWKGIIASVRARPIVLPSALVAFLGVSAPKVVPVLESLGTRKLSEFVEDGTLGKLVWSAFYDPDQWFLREMRPLPWRMHEIGCYLGFAATAVIFVALLRGTFWRAQWRWIVFAVFFAWIGANWLSPVNPWELITNTPLLRNAHVQSRLFIWLYFAWIVLFCAAVRALRRRPSIAYVIAVAAVVEIVVVSQRQWHRAMQNVGGEARYLATARDIEARAWNYTVPWGTKPEHYFAGGFGSYDTYEPAAPKRGVAYRGGPRYGGEIRVLADQGSATIEEISPSLISFVYEGPTPAPVRINQNRLGGWEAVAGDAAVIDDGNAVNVLVQTPGTVVLRYQPWYWPDVVWAYACGILAFTGIAITLRRRGAL